MEIVLTKSPTFINYNFGHTKKPNFVQILNFSENLLLMVYNFRFSKISAILRYRPFSNFLSFFKNFYYFSPFHIKYKVSKYLIFFFNVFQNFRHWIVFFFNILKWLKYFRWWNILLCGKRSPNRTSVIVHAYRNTKEKFLNFKNNLSTIYQKATKLKILKTKKTNISKKIINIRNNLSIINLRICQFA